MIWRRNRKRKEISQKQINLINFRKEGQNVHNNNNETVQFKTAGDREMLVDLKKRAIFPKK
jgi:hypothetical protein